MKIAVVGGGMSGLSAAYYLSRRGHHVVLFEKDNQLGGLAAGVEIEGGFVDKYYHHIFAGDRFMIDLIKEVGLGERLVFKKPQTAIFFQGQIYPFTSALDLLRFTPLGFIDRLRFGVVGLYLKAIPDGKKYSTVAAQDWLERNFGERAYQVIWEPLLRSKFGEHAGDVSMAWFWSRAHDRSFSLGYLRGGFQILVERMRGEIEKTGGVVKSGVSYFDHDRGSNRTHFDKVIVTTPLPVFLDLFKDLPSDYVRELETIKFRSALSMILVLKKSFMKPYWLNVNDSSFPFVAVVEQTNFIPPTDYRGHHILYIGGYYPQNHRFFKMKKEEIFQEFLPYLQKINPEFDPSFIIHYSLFTGLYAQPIVTTDYESKMPPFETPVKNVYLATMAQVYPQDRGMNQAVKLGKDVAEIVVA